MIVRERVLRADCQPKKRVIESVGAISLAEQPALANWHVKVDIETKRTERKIKEENWTERGFGKCASCSTYFVLCIE